MSELKRLLTAEQVVALLGISERTFFRLKHEPDFPRPVRLGRAKRYRPEEVEKFIANRQRAK